MIKTRPCALTLVRRHVFKAAPRRRGGWVPCICGAEPTPDELEGLELARRQAEREEREAQAARIRRWDYGTDDA